MPLKKPCKVITIFNIHQVKFVNIKLF